MSHFIPHSCWSVSSKWQITINITWLALSYLSCCLSQATHGNKDLIYSESQAPGCEEACHTDRKSQSVWCCYLHICSLVTWQKTTQSQRSKRPQNKGDKHGGSSLHSQGKSHHFGNMEQRWTSSSYTASSSPLREHKLNNSTMVTWMPLGWHLFLLLPRNKVTWPPLEEVLGFHCSLSPTLLTIIARYFEAVFRLPAKRSTHTHTWTFAYENVCSFLFFSF